MIHNWSGLQEDGVTARGVGEPPADHKVERARLPGQTPAGLAAEARRAPVQKRHAQPIRDGTREGR
jgi:hypothetical protein